MKNIQSIVIAGLLVIIAILLLKSCSKQEQQTNIEQVSEIASEKLKIATDKYGQEVASKNAIQADLSSLKIVDAKKDSMLKALQEKVTKLTVSATVFSSSTSGTSTTATRIIEPGLIAYSPEEMAYSTAPFGKEYSIYEGSKESAWIKYKIIASKDSIHLEYTCFNSFEVIQEYKKNPFWKRKEVVVHITSKNPNTKTLDAESFIRPEKRSGRGYYLIAGIIVGALLVR